MEKEKLLRIFLLYFIVLIFLGTETMANNSEYTVTKRDDNGYTISIWVNKRVWKLITPEGFFPKQQYECTLDIIGTGEAWTEKVKGLEGYYYPVDKLESKQKYWDIGFAWVDTNRKYLYLNLYWISAPNEIMPADINGKYKLKK